MIDLAPLLQNQVFSGVAGAAVVSGVLYQLRAIPTQLWMLAKDQFSATLTVYSEQDAFRLLDLWVGRHPSAKRARRVALTEQWDGISSRNHFEMTAGIGPHILWESRTPIFVTRDVDNAPTGPRRQSLKLTTIGRGRKLLERLVSEAREVQDRDAVAIYMWRGHFELVERRQRRSLESVHLAPGLRDEIVADAERFALRREWYAERGVPYRRGYLFEGPPGTGKSSMALALAGELRKPIYVINPATLDDDNELQRAINGAGAGVVLIEDIDAIERSRSRARKPKPATPGAPETVTAASGISTSGLLNAIDGVAAREGRILIITTNHAEHLDAALLRPGRVDMRCHFNLAGLTEALAMYRRFCPDGDEVGFARQIGPELPLSQAEIQNRLLKAAA
jgi:mitochondrial chaperone BCS1